MRGLLYLRTHRRSLSFSFLQGTKRVENGGFADLRAGQRRKALDFTFSAAQKQTTQTIMPNIRTKVEMLVTIPAGAQSVFGNALAEYAESLGAKDVNVTTVAERSSEETSVCVPGDEVARDVPCSHDMLQVTDNRLICRKCGEEVFI